MLAPQFQKKGIGADAPDIQVVHAKRKKKPVPAASRQALLALAARLKGASGV